VPPRRHLLIGRTPSEPRDAWERRRQPPHGVGNNDGIREFHMRTTDLLAIVGAALIVTGCETASRLVQSIVPTPSAEAPKPMAEEMVWIRTDGQRGAGNPVLQRQYEIDVAACPGAAQRSPKAAPCMRQRGYILAPRSRAESLLQDFARARN
jgi:hypothetical protein